MQQGHPTEIQICDPPRLRHLPGVALKSALAQKYAFTKKFTIFTQSL